MRRVDWSFEPDWLGGATGWSAERGVDGRRQVADRAVLVAEVYRRPRGRDGLGVGDAKLLAALGALVCWQGLPSVILFAASADLAWALTTAAVRRSGQADSTSGLAAKSALDPGQGLPFGPFLCLAGWLVWLYGPLTLG